MPEDKKEKDVKWEYTSIRIDPNLWKEMKIEAIRQDIDVSTLTARAFKHELERSKN
jgi:hypothetical protein